MTFPYARAVKPGFFPGFTARAYGKVMSAGGQSEDPIVLWPWLAAAVGVVGDQPQ